MMNSTEIKPRLDDELRLRVLRVKGIIPKKFDYVPLYTYEFGDQTEEHINKLRNVWNLRSTDEEMTQRLELIADKIKHA